MVINVLHFCFELRMLKMTSKMKQMIALFLMNGIYLISLIQNTLRYLCYDYAGYLHKMARVHK